MDQTVLLCLLCVQVCALTAASLQASHTQAVSEEGIRDDKNLGEVLGEVWSQVEAGMVAKLGSRIKRQDKKPRTRPGSSSALLRPGPQDTRISSPLKQSS